MVPMRLRSASVVACCVLLAACGQKSSPSSAPATAAAGPPPAFAGAVMSGGNTEALRSYLRTVQPVEPTKFKVKWTPATVEIGRDAALQSLLGVSRYGTDYVFDSSEPALARLEPGNVLFIWGVALRKVTAVDRAGKVTVVHTVPAALQEAIASGEIEFEHAPAMRNYMLVPREPMHVAAGTSTVPQSALRPVSLRLAEASGPPEPGGGDAADAGPPVPQATAKHHFKGSYKGFAYTVAFVPGDDGLHFDVQVRKGDDGSAADATESNPSEGMREADQKAREKTRKGIHDLREGPPNPQAHAQVQGAKAAEDYAKDRANPVREPAGKAGRQLMDMASDLLDMRIQAEGVLQGVTGSDQLTLFGRMVFQDGAVSLLQSKFKDLTGTVNVQYIVRRGELSEQWMEKLRLDLPFTFNVPIIVGGLPLMAQLAFDIVAKPALATKNDAFRGAFTFRFKGSGGTEYSAGKPSAEAKMTGEGEARDAQASSIGVSALLIALQAPRFGLGIGLFGANAIGYIDMVTSTGITSAGMLGMFPCRKWDSNWTINAGIDAKALIFEKDFRTDPPLLSKEWHRVEPPIRACELGQGQ